ncbi:MAG: TPM domain-containing protein [Erysipelotrichaceae bacterium]|nr:TPM domain-containing protein [Erysipelotrichaceae bacterium]
MLRKVKVLILISLLCVLFTPFKISAEKNYRIVIEDNEDLLTATEESMLYSKMEYISEYGNVGFVTVSQYTSTDQYARNKYRELFGRESGMLFVIDMGRRNIWIYCDGAIYRIINKPYANTITDNVYRMASKQEYYRCAYEVFDEAQTLLEGGRISQPMKYISNVFIALVMALLANFIYLAIQRSEDGNNAEDMVKAMSTGVSVGIISKVMTSSRKTRHVESSGGSGGGGYSGGGGGGGGGGGSSGGGGGHSF